MSPHLCHPSLSPRAAPGHSIPGSDVPITSLVRAPPAELGRPLGIVTEAHLRRPSPASTTSTFSPRSPPIPPPSRPAGSHNGGLTWPSQPIDGVVAFAFPDGGRTCGSPIPQRHHVATTSSGAVECASGRPVIVPLAAGSAGRKEWAASRIEAVGLSRTRPPRCHATSRACLRVFPARRQARAEPTPRRWKRSRRP